MRLILAIPLFLAAACGSDTAPQEKKAGRAASLDGGQFALESEVSSLSSVDQGAPAINSPVGTKASQSVCVPGSGRAPTELFSGEGYECSYNNYYVRNGRINALLTCRRAGLQGEIAMTVDGTFESGQLSFNRNVRTILATDGDVLINYRVTGRRTGECAAAGSTEGNQAGE